MVDISKDRLNTLKKNFEGKKIAVIGDMMLDGYFWGDVKRISPEAPVPVLEVEEEFFRFGGAANVALNILKLGGLPIPIGVIGYDNFGTIFTSLIKEANIESHGIIVDESRPTTTKTRVIANNHHVVRIDKESKKYLNEKTEKKLSSYDNFFAYRNVTVFKPNRKEAEEVLGIKIKKSDDVTTAGTKLLEELQAKYILLTLGDEGIAVFEQDNKEKRMATKAKKVADVSGAGDTVISTLTLALAAGADVYEASLLANYAAGIVCGEVGIVPVEKKILFDTVLKDNL
jgi:bifunctional ADP-heptose synthase (sugar kinase/adenylyltransferase)